MNSTSPYKLMKSGTLSQTSYDLLELTVLKASNLRKADYFGKSDPYIQISILDEHDQESQIVNTTVIQKTLKPTIN